MKKYCFVNESDHKLMFDMIKKGKITSLKPKFLISRKVDSDFLNFKHPNPSFAVYKKGTVPYYSTLFDINRLSSNSVNLFPYPERVLPSDTVKSILYSKDIHSGRIDHLIDRLYQLGYPPPHLKFTKGTKKYAIYKRLYDKLMDCVVRNDFNGIKSILLSKPYDGDYAIIRSQVPFVLRKINSNPKHTYGEIKKYSPIFLNGDYYSRALITPSRNSQYIYRKLKNLGIRPDFVSTPQEFIDVTKTIKGITENINKLK